MYGIASTTETLNTLFLNGGTLLAFSIGTILLGLVGLLGLGFGIDKLMRYITGNGFDRSGQIGGFYYWNTPYKGYNRWRSRTWNMEHMP